MRITKDFYMQSALTMAPQLLGKFLCRKTDHDVLRLRITEVEVYYGEDDTACHASKGKTNRTKVMYEEGGVAYVYLCYGIHHLLNIVTGEKDFPQAVLIRGVAGYNGPGKLTKFLQIDRTLNGEDLGCSQQLWLEDDGYAVDYTLSQRVGIAYAAKEDQEKLWRFIADTRSN